MLRGEGKVDARLDGRVMEQVTGRFAFENVRPLGEIMRGRRRRHEESRLDRARLAA